MRTRLLACRRNTVDPPHEEACHEHWAIRAVHGVRSGSTGLTGSMICEYFERESDRSRCLGPEASAVMNGSDTGAVSEEHNSALAASAA